MPFIHMVNVRRHLQLVHQHRPTNPKHYALGYSGGLVAIIKMVCYAARHLVILWNVSRQEKQRR